MIKELRTEVMDVLEVIDLHMDSTDSSIFLMKIQEDNKTNYYLVHTMSWDTPDILLLIKEQTYNDLKQATPVEVEK